MENKITTYQNRDITSIIDEGKKILEENNFFKNLDNVMSDSKFRTFYDTYFKDYSDIKTVILYMKLYETIQKEYLEINKCEIEKEFLMFIMKELMSNIDTLKTVMNSFKDYENYNENNSKNNSKKYILNIFSELNLKNKSIKDL